MDTSLITEEIIKKIILGKVNQNEEKYWIKSISRISRSTLKGTIVEVASTDEIGGGISTIVFDKFSLVIDGALKEYEKEINQDYIEILCQCNDEFKKFYDDAMLKIDAKTAEFRLRLVENFYENGYVKNDIKGIFKGAGVADLQARLEQNKHSEIIAPIDNKFKKIRVIDIKPGQIITADLNPVLENEMGGIRPVLVVKVFQRDVVILPLSSEIENKHNNKTYFLPKGKYNGFYNKDSVVCIDHVKTISKDRLLHNITEIDNKDFDEVLDLLAENILGKKFNIDEFNIEMPFSDEEIADYENQLKSEFELTSDVNEMLQDNQDDSKPIQNETINEPLEETKIFTEFVLTEEEAIAIAERKLIYVKNNQRGYEIDNLEFVNVDKQGNYIFSAVGFFTKSKEDIDKAEIQIGKFYGRFKMGRIIYTNDYNLDQLIYSTMFEKYGENYKKAFILTHYFRALAKYNEKGRNYSDLVEKFRRALATAGCVAKDIDKLIKDQNFDIKSDLVPLVPSYENESVDMEEVVKNISLEDINQNKYIAQPIVKNDNVLDFELTDEEVTDIVVAKINRMHAKGSKLIFSDAEISGDGFLKNGIKFYFNRNCNGSKQNVFSTMFELNPFSAYFCIGDRQINYDFDLLEIMANKLSEKYPDIYPRLFAKKHIERQNRFYVTLNDLEKCSRNLTKLLSFVGKKSADVEELVKYGLEAYKFEDLIDITSEEEN